MRGDRSTANSRHGTLARGLALAGLAAVLAVAVVVPAGAQTGDQLQAELDRTDEVIARARLAVTAAGSPSFAQGYLDQAEELQAMARNAFAAGFFANAARLTLSARERAFAAIRLTQQAGSEDFLRFMLERTAALLDRVAPVVRESDSEPAHRMLDAALEAQRRAQQALAEGQFRAALSLTLQARERAMRALRLAEAGSGRMVDRAPRAVERTEELLADSAWLTEAGEKAARDYEAALRLNAQARTRLMNGQHEAALRLAELARERLLRALGHAERPLARAAVEAAVERSQERLARAEDLASTPAQHQAVARAHEHQRRAEQHLRAGRLAPCLAEVRAVRSVLERAGL